MPGKKPYRGEVDELIKLYTKRLENDAQHKKKLLTGKDMLALLHAEGKYPYRKRLAIEAYETTLAQLQIELVKAQYWVQKTQQRLAVVFEGRDAAGKGGTIQRFMTNLNPRYINYVALPKPSSRERSQWYFQRYIPHLPAAGEISFFDRSWYNRAGVEKVMGYCSAEEYQSFMASVTDLEAQWVEAGIVLIKYWLSIEQVEQLRRFRRRQTSELRRWKLSPNDIDSLGTWQQYSDAIQAMFKKTSHSQAPWYVVKTDDKKRGRIECIRHFLACLNYPDKDQQLIAALDDNIVIRKDIDHSKVNK